MVSPVRVTGQEALHVSVGVSGLPLAVNPKVVLPLAGTVPFHDSLRTETEEPEPDVRPPHSWVMDGEPDQLQFTVQPLIAALPARTVTSDWKPPGQLLTVRIVALHPLPGCGLGLGLGLTGGVGLGLTGGVGLGLGLTGGVGLGEVLGAALLRALRTAV